MMKYVLYVKEAIEMTAQKFSPHWQKILPFIIFHLIALYSLVTVPLNSHLFFLFLSLYFLRIFGATAGYHRYFSHRSFKTSRFMQFVFAYIANLTLMRGPLTWAAHHR